MTKKQLKVLLVEDNETRGKAIETALKKTLRTTYELERFRASDTDSDGAYEDRLHKALTGKNFKDLTLVVTDRDLSALTGYRGLSEAIISKVAMDLSIPVCIYAAGKGASLLERHRSGGGGRILLSSSDPNSMARKVRALADGFREIHDVVASISHSKKERQKYRGPAAVLADLLKAREVVDQLALYTRGDQRMIAGVTPTDPKKPGHSTDNVRSISLALGVWLYDSILRFPGVILDFTATASFLGIEPTALRDAAVQEVFKEALYHGPFAETDEPRWWRHRLVELLNRNNVREHDGAVLVKSETGKTVKPCVCSYDKKAPAGYFCVMTETPVCDEHSVGQVSWLPRGADLARVRTDLYEQIGPWVGMS